MNPIHRSQSFAPNLNTLENRALLSGMGMSMGMASEITVMETPIYNKMMTEVVSIRLTATVEAVPMAGMSMGTPTGKVSVEMIMPAGSNIPGMKVGVNKLGTMALHHGTATFKLKAVDVVGMPIEVLYSGSMKFDPSTVTPPMNMDSAPMSGMKM